MSGGNGQADQMVLMLLQEIERLKQAVPVKVEKTGAGALFPPKPDSEGFKYYLLSENHVKDKGGACIVAGSQAMISHLRHGVTMTEPGVKRFSDLENAVSAFFQSNPKKYTVLLRR